MSFLRLENEVVVGIDPGLTGGICILGLDSVRPLSLTPFPLKSREVENKRGGKKPTRTIRSYDLDAINGMFRQLRETERAWVYLESVHSMPGNGTASMFLFGQLFGQLQGLLIANRLPYKLVEPSEWSSRCRELSREGDPKARAKAAYKATFPNHIQDWCMTRKKRSMPDGLIDAAMIAEYGRYRIKNGIERG